MTSARPQSSSRPLLVRPVVGFDLDMTLVDSAAGIVATFAAAAAQVPGGQSARTSAADIWPYIGLPLEVTARDLAPQADPDELAQRYRALYAETGVPLTTLLPGVLDALAAVRAAGGRILVVSAKRIEGVHEVLAQVGLHTGALAPDVIAGGLFAEDKGVRLRAEHADIYVGDHPGDVVAATVAGAFRVGVATGPTSAQALADAGADVVLPGLEQFRDWFATVLAVQPAQYDPGG